MPPAVSQQPWSASFSPDQFDGAECRRLRLALGLNAEKMAVIAGLPGRWAWLSIENGYESIESERWGRCLVELDNRRTGTLVGFPTPTYHFDAVSVRHPSNLGW